MGLKHCRISGPEEGCFYDREKKNACGKTGLKIKKETVIKKRIRGRKWRRIIGKREEKAENEGRTS